MAKFKVAFDDLRSFMWSYARGQYGPERLGQAFVNEFLVDRQDPDLFYEEDNHKAYQMISKYVNWED